MAVLKDVRCSVCKGVSEEWLDGGVSTVYRHCDTCEKDRVHDSCCNGGVKVITWSMEGVDALDYVDGCTQVMVGKPRKEDIGTGNESKNAKPVTTRDGTPIHELPRFKDGLKERRDKRMWKANRKRYGAKLFYT